MGRKFFGQFLLERGKISRQALLDAVRFQSEVNRSLGQIALDRDLLTPEQAVQIHSEQRVRDLYFGEIAIEFGFLSDEQVRELLGIQKNNYIYLGEALVEKGHLTRLELERLLLEFSEEDTLTAPLHLQWATLSISDPGSASVCVDQMQKLLLRICGLRTKVGEVSRGATLGDGAPVASIPIIGDLEWRLLMAFGSGEDFPRQFTCRFLGQDTSDPELIADSCREFMNIVGGSVVTVLRGLGVRLDLRPPTTLNEPPELADLLVVPLFAPEGELQLGIHGIS